MEWILIKSEIKKIFFTGWDRTVKGGFPVNAYLYRQR